MSVLLLDQLVDLKFHTVHALQRCPLVTNMFVTAIAQIEVLADSTLFLSSFLKIPSFSDALMNLSMLSMNTECLSNFEPLSVSSLLALGLADADDSTAHGLTLWQLHLNLCASVNTFKTDNWCFFSAFIEMSRKMRESLNM